MLVPTLTDGVVTLRGHREDDLEGCLEQSADPLSQQWTAVPVPYTREDARRFLRDAMPGGWAADVEWGFAIEAVDPAGTRRFAGTVTLRNHGQRRAEIAYGAHPWARGTGIVERALRLLLDWGFSPVEVGGRDLETVIWWAEEGNWASRKTAWRLGFSCDGTVRAWLPSRAGLRSAWVGCLRREDRREPRTPWWEAPTILGERVTLRRHRPEDVARIVEACSDPETIRWLGNLPAPYDEADAHRYLLREGELLAAGTGVGWAVADPDTDALLGSLSVFDIGSVSGAEIGYWAHPDARGRGVVSGAVRLAVRHAFVPVEDGGLGLDKLRLVAAVDNLASRRVAQVNQFREAGTERAGTVCRDGRHDAVIYDLLPSDLLSSRENV